jgi:hypothetical protein
MDQAQRLARQARIRISETFLGDSGVVEPGRSRDSDRVACCTRQCWTNWVPNTCCLVRGRFQQSQRDRRRHGHSTGSPVAGRCPKRRCSDRPGGDDERASPLRQQHGQPSRSTGIPTPPRSWSKTRAADCPRTFSSRHVSRSRRWASASRECGNECASSVDASTSRGAAVGRWCESCCRCPPDHQPPNDRVSPAPNWT